MAPDPITSHLRYLDPVSPSLHLELTSDDGLVLAQILAQPRTTPASRHRKPAPPRWPIPIAALVVCALAVVVILVLISGSRMPTQTAATWRLVGFSSTPFRDLGNGQGQPGLQCVTDQICYSPGSGNQSTLIYKTLDGGQHWSTIAPLPEDDQSGAHGFACASTSVCFVSARAAGIAITDDGGASWSTISTPAPMGADRGAWCADAQHCVITETTTTGTPVAFMTTTDGGAHWSTQTAPTVSGYLWTTSCDPDGRCIEVFLGGPAGGAATVTALTSHAWGGPWQAESPTSIGHVAIVHYSCPDATHCMLVALDSPFEIVTTTDGGATWQVSGPPAGWLNMPTAVGCANDDDCWVATSLYDANNPDGAYSHPVIEATRDFGNTWSTLSLPATTPATADVLTLSCPPPGDGCLAIGNGKDHFVPPPGPRNQKLSGPILLSSLPE